MKKYYHTSKIVFFSCVFLITGNLLSNQENIFDVSVAGFINFADGIGRQTIGFIDCVKDDVKINFINTRPHMMLNLADVPHAVQHIILNSTESMSNVSVLEDVLSNGNPIIELREDYYKLLPDSHIKLAYTMFESNYIPSSWPTILNEHFDAAVVPDKFLVDVYKDAGVTIPIFVLPLGIYIDDFLDQPIKHEPHKPFVFGFTGSFSPRKNHMVLLESFVRAFGNNPEVLLKIHGRSGSEIAAQLKERVAELEVTNVEIIEQTLSWHEYIEFIKSIDCYVALSKGEGFSITPREAMALGIPCVVTNNTAHQTICESGLVKIVECPITQPAYYPHLEEVVGVEFNCTINDAAEALKEVYENYNQYLQNANCSRSWVQQYLYPNLRPYYCSLIKPANVFLSDHNALEDNCLITDNQQLYEKYVNLINICNRLKQETT